jgi:hypothetical protein
MLVLGSFIIIMWALALVSLILAVVLWKKKPGRLAFMIMAALFGLIPLLLYAGMHMEHEEGRENYQGNYTVQHPTGGYVVLTLKDNSFTCSAERCGGQLEGKWDYHEGDVEYYIDFEPDNGFMRQAVVNEHGTYVHFRSLRIGSCELDDVMLEKAAW